MAEAKRKGRPDRRTSTPVKPNAPTNPRQFGQLQGTIPYFDLKTAGELAEMAFQLAASRLGFSVSKPFGDNVKYDFVTDWKGKLLRVQVKSCRVKTKDKYRVQVTHGGKSQSYTDQDIDVVAAYVSPEDAWYLIPVNNIDGKNIDLRPGKQSTGKYEKFFETWEILK
jgi:hypothetical protein